MFLEILTLILPIAAALLVGMAGRRFGWFTPDGVGAFKTVVGKVMLPLILFNAMFTAEYSASALATILTCFLGMNLALGAGWLLRRLLPERAKYLPFLITTCESGMLGYPLIAMLFGAEGTQQFALADLPNAVFFFTICISLLQVADGLRPTPRALAGNVLRATLFQMMVLGMALGLCGADERLRATVLWEPYSAVISFLTGPTTVLILIYLGYSLSFKKELLRPVIAVSLLRFAVMGAMGALAAFLAFRFVPFDRVQLAAIALLFLLPPSYSLPMFSDLKGHEEFVSTTISFSTLLSLLAFVAMAAIALRA